VKLEVLYGAHAGNSRIRAPSAVIAKELTL